MKYGIGQRVRVKDFETLKEEYGVNENGEVEVGDYIFTREMKIFCGEKCRILNAFADGTYDLDLKGSEEWYFTDQMLETEDSQNTTLVAQLKAENEQLKTENETLKQKIAELEKLLNTEKPIYFSADNNLTYSPKPKRTYTRRK